MCGGGSISNLHEAPPVRSGDNHLLSRTIALRYCHHHLLHRLRLAAGVLIELPTQPRSLLCVTPLCTARVEPHAQLVVRVVGVSHVVRANAALLCVVPCGAVDTSRAHVITRSLKLLWAREMLFIALVPTGRRQRPRLQQLPMHLKLVRGHLIFDGRACRSGTAQGPHDAESDEA